MSKDNDESDSDDGYAISTYNMSFMLAVLSDACTEIPTQLLQLILETTYYLGSPICCPGCNEMIDQPLQMCPNRAFMNNRFLPIREIHCPDCVPGGYMPSFSPESGGFFRTDVRMNEGERYRECLGSMHKRCTNCETRICCACSCGGFCEVCIPLHLNFCAITAKCVHVLLGL